MQKFTRFVLALAFAAIIGLGGTAPAKHTPAKPSPIVIQCDPYQCGGG